MHLPLHSFNCCNSSCIGCFVSCCYSSIYSLVYLAHLIGSLCRTPSLLLVEQKLINISEEGNTTFFINYKAQRTPLDEIVGTLCIVTSSIIYYEGQNLKKHYRRCWRLQQESFLGSYNWEAVCKVYKLKMNDCSTAHQEDHLCLAGQELTCFSRNTIERQTTHFQTSDEIQSTQIVNS